MIEQLGSARDQLRIAWDNYFQVYKNVLDHHAQSAHGFPAELSHQIDTEITFISSYESEMEQLKIAIRRARNYSSGFAPINTLPPEILTRIFHLAQAQPCSFHKLSSSDRIHHLRYPDYLTQVCVSWRKTAIASRSLWCHIDLFPYEPDQGGLIARAETYVARANGFPIELHAADIESKHSRRRGANHQLSDLYALIARISSCVKSLEFVVTDRFRPFHRSVLGELLLHKSSTLTKLAILSDNDHQDSFITPDPRRPAETDVEARSFRLALSQKRIESSFAPLTVLHLRGIFPVWSSVAYCGLTDLRLLSTSAWSHIKEAEFITILKSSPRLRVLYFGLKLQDPSPAFEPESPVDLPELEVVKIFPESGDRTRQCPSAVLRLLGPGSTPLRLSFRSRYEPNFYMVTELNNFLDRARVTRFHTFGVFPPISSLLRHAGHLEQVVLDNLQTYCSDDLPRVWLQVDELTLLPRLKSIYITRSNLSESELSLLVKCCPTGIVLDSSDIDRDVRGAWIGPNLLSANELKDAFPSVRAVDHVLGRLIDPTADWDILD